MIINVNGVNVDTNTMRSDSEIRSLITTNTSNMMTRTLLKSFTVNQSYATGQVTQIGTFDFADSSMYEYVALVIELVGTMSLTASSSGTCYFYLEMLSDSGDSFTIAYLSADKNTTTTVSNARVILQGTTPERTTGVYRRSFVTGDMGIEFDGTFSGLVRVQPSNSPSSVRVNGTLNIYGIK